MKRAAFLDRDGVITKSVIRNGKHCAPFSLEEFELIGDASEGITVLKKAGLNVVVVTNQPDVGKGEVAKDVVEAMHERLRAQAPLDDIKVCFHTNADQCECRKPKPGMLRQAAKEMNIDLSRSFMVGDRWSDMEAGRAAGCFTILIGDGYGEKFSINPDMKAASLWEASQIMLSSLSVSFQPNSPRVDWRQ
ncbi:MAG: HAD family hydrolase [Elusimicrobia bacterium]|nr:HAD family hydrolase [Elusimicrobiota bacterium]